MNNPEERINWKDKKFLIVEDDEASIAYLTEIFEETGAELIYSDSGNEAIKICKNDPEIDLVLMDIQLPELNGFEATKIIKRHRSNLPVIAQTAYAMASDRKRCFEAGCDDYAAKPFDRDQLILKIQRLLR